MCIKTHELNASRRRTWTAAEPGERERRSERGEEGETKTKTVSLEEASSAFTAQRQKRLTVVGAEMCKQNTKVATKVARIKAQKIKK